MTMENGKLKPVNKMNYPVDLLPGYKGLFIPVSRGSDKIEDHSEIQINFSIAVSQERKPVAQQRIRKRERVSHSLPRKTVLASGQPELEPSVTHCATGLSNAKRQGPYTPTPNYTEANKIINMGRLLSMPSLPLTQVDHGRNREVHEFYLLCQMQRDQYRDRSGRLHPLDYFQTTDYKWQSPPDLTRDYLKHPDSYIKYYRPTVFAQTTARTVPLPPLPGRSLSGCYYRHSDTSYKR